MPDRELMLKNLEHIFYPKSLAVVGTNKVQGTVPCDILFNILKADFQGVVFPVSPKEPFIAGVKAYKYVTDIPDPVDLAILVFPSSVCHMALEQCGQKGVKAAIIISAGFREVGQAGLERERQIKEIANKYGISFIGPNCLGVINTDPTSLLNASFARKMPEEGVIGFLSQSGALCTAVLDYANPKHIGFSKFVSFGNKASVSEIDLLYYLRDDPKTKVILLYLEEITDGRGLMKAARDVIENSGKPVLILKSGRTSEGASAAASHTGSLAGSDDICDAALKQAGIIRCETIEEMFNKAIAMAYQPLPKGNRVAIVTNAGGPGVLATDAAVKEGLVLGKFSESTTEIFRKELPKTANIKNPVDVIGDARADRYQVAMKHGLTDDGVDGAIVILTPQSMTDIDTIANEVANIARDSTKPVYTSFMGQGDVATGIHILEKKKIPHYILPESAAKAMAAAWRFGESIKKKYVEPEPLTGTDKAKANRLLDDAVKSGRSWLTEDSASPILAAYGLPVKPHGLAKSQDEAAAIAEKIGFPVVMKIVSDDVVHKSEAGGVVVDIRDSAAAKKAYETILSNVKTKLPGAVVQGVFVRKMIDNGAEVILGVKRDPSFGPVVMFGLGGIFVEIFKDITFRVAPLSIQETEEMVRSVRSWPILAGARGGIKRDAAAIVDCVRRLGQLAFDCPRIRELDINPLIVQPEGKGASVADVRIML